MLKIFRQIISFGLALVLMLSTLSFTISKHYCSNILVDTSVVKPAKSCGMHTLDKGEQDHQSEKDSCCDEDVKIIEGQDELKIDFNDFSLDLPDELVVFSIIYSFPENYTFKAESHYNIYQPPECHCDFQLLHQVFLI